MRKIGLLIVSIISVFTLIGCVNETELHTITLELNGGVGESSVVALTGKDITEPTPVKDGYIFDGWYIDVDFQTKFEFTTMPDNDFTLYAKWENEDALITLELNGGIGTNLIIVRKGSTTNEVIPTKSGFVFDGWYIDANFDTSYSFDQTVHNDFTLYAKWKEIGYDISLSSTVEGVTPSFVTGDTIDNEQSYIITATEIEGYDFLYWRIQNTTEVVSMTLRFTYVPTSDVSLEAVYQEQTNANEPVLFYETDFEDGAKGSYAEDMVSLSGETWTLSDALIGSLATDLSVSGKSVRIRDGFISTEFQVTNLAQMIFYAGTYGSDDNSQVTLSLSTDKITWITVDTFTTSNSLEEYNYIFDEALFSSLSLNKADGYYIKLDSSGDGRVNIDNVFIYTGEGQLIDDTPLYTIVLADDMKFSYLLNEEVDLDMCVATHPTLGNTTCDILGEVDNTVAGSYEITYYKVDEFGNIATKVITITIISEDTTDYLSMDLFEYYDDAEGLYGEALVDALHLIINDGFSGVTYGDARDILDETDQDPNNLNNLILLYLGTSVNGNWDSGITWNREHIWPQSLLGVSADNAKVNEASDLYNLMPADPGENSSRGNSPYSEMGLGYEPRDEVKGDIARALFYMYIMYDQLDLVDYTPSVYEMGYLNELLAWHVEDPVDEFELARLEVIFDYQHNRNPFVDYPHFVELIWFYQE
jgi:uncharacterized repeat protein (TIGR02543 family)